jgi:hypothetical protein
MRISMSKAADRAGETRATGLLSFFLKTTHAPYAAQISQYSGCSQPLAWEKLVSIEEFASLHALLAL